MMLVWIIYAALVGGLVAIGAFAADRVARIARLPIRGIWAAGIGLAIVLAMRAPSVAATVNLPTIGYVAGADVQTTAERSWRAALSARIEEAARWLDVSRAANALGAAAIARVDDRVIAGAWIALSATLGLVFLGVHARLGRSRRRWPRASVDGQPVRVAPRVGPAAMGLVRSEVVVPRWLLARSDADQRMAVTHEREHIRARDPQLLAAACVALILFPWNPAMWYLVGRLRLAIELDCDRRVLRRGAQPHAYSTLLVAVAELATPLRPSALALADDSSHLHTRILAMATRRYRFARTQTVAAAVLGAVALLAACEAKAPTAADIDRMDGASAESAAHKLGVLRPVDTAVAYMVDGAKVTAAEARAVPASDIERMSVSKGEGSEPTVLITKKGSLALERRRPAGDSSLAAAVSASAVAAAHGSDGRGGRGGRSSAGGLKLANDTAIVWFLNGVQVDYATSIRSLDRKDIDAVEVVKGPAAAQPYNVPLGKAVVAIRTKQ